MRVSASALLLLSLLLVGVAPAQDSLNVRSVGSWPFGPSEAVAIDSARDLAFAGSGGGIYVIDVSVPASPVKLSEVKTRGVVRGLCYLDNRLYVADAGAGLRIISVADPAHPTEVGYHDTRWALGVAVAGSHAYVADYDAGLRVIDVSDPANPQECGHCDTPGRAEGVAVAGSYAYVADHNAGLRVIDVSDPSHPQERGYCDTPGSALGVAAKADHVYVTDADSGLRVISVSDPAHPVEVGYYDTPGEAWGVAVAGNYAYVADRFTGLRVIEFYGAGVEESPSAEVRTPNRGPTIVRGVLFLPSSVLSPHSSLLSVDGRKVTELHAGPNDVGRLSSGVYFVRQASGVMPDASNVTKVVVQR